MEIKFGIMSDLHTDIIHDGERRLQYFIDRCEKEKVDFGIQLGDFIHPHGVGSYVCTEEKVSPVMRNILAKKGLSDAKKDRLLDMFNKTSFPTYHVLGNHDLDLYSKTEVTGYWNMTAPYYSFDQNGFHFVVLDANYGLDGETEVSFEYGNYMKWMFMPTEPFPVIPPTELKWLRDDLKANTKPTIVFSHEGLGEGFLNAKNSDEIFDVLTENPGQVILCIYGHKHQDLFDMVRGIPVYGMNSMSGYSVPAKFAAHRFEPEIEEKYPNVQYMAIYKEPLMGIVHITEDEIIITGGATEFVPPTPQELGITFTNKDIKLAPNAGSYRIPRKRG